jgi:hypothetical protein
MPLSRLGRFFSNWGKVLKKKKLHAVKIGWVFFKLWEGFKKEEMLVCFVEEQKIMPYNRTIINTTKKKKTKPTWL